MSTDRMQKPKRNSLSSIGIAMVAVGLIGFNIGCGGTEVGNAFKSQILIGGSDDAPSSLYSNSTTQLLSSPLEALQSQSLQGAGIFADSLSPTSVSVSLSDAFLSIRRIAIPPQSDCNEALPEISQWKRSTQNILVDWLSDTPQSLDLDLGADFTTCQIRIILGPALSGEYRGSSIFYQGQVSNSSASSEITVQSSQAHLVIIRSDTPFSLDASLGRNLEIVSFRGGFFEGPVANTIAELIDHSNSIEVNPVATPSVFSHFLTRLRNRTQAFRWERQNNSIIRKRSNAVGTGVDDPGAPVEGEI